MFEKGKAAHEDRYSFSLKATCPVSDWFLLAPLACVNHPGELAGLWAFVLPGFTHDMNQGNTFAMFFPPFTIVSCSTILCKNPTRPCPKPQGNRAPNHNKTVPQTTAKLQVIQPFLQTCPASARPGELLLCPSPACLEPAKPRPHLFLGELRAVAACPHPLHPQQEPGGQQPPANWGEKFFSPL